MWQPPKRIKHELPAATWPAAEQAAHAMLFQPIQLGNRVAKQRTWVPAMVPWRSTDEGFVTPDVIDWYSRFAEGRPGVIVVEATGIRDIPSGPLLRIGHPRFLPGLRRLTDAVRAASGGETRLFIQLIDFLRIKRRPEKEKFFARFLPIEPYHGERLAELTGEPSFASADETRVREKLAALTDDELLQVLTKREMEDYLFGYRERVWDMHLPHIRELPQVLPGLFSA